MEKVGPEHAEITTAGLQERLKLSKVICVQLRNESAASTADFWVWEVWCVSARARVGGWKLVVQSIVHLVAAGPAGCTGRTTTFLTYFHNWMLLFLEKQSFGSRM